MGAYVLLQFSWWAYLLMYAEGPRSHVMVLGEGVVFAGLLLWGVSRLDRGLQLDALRLKRERNFLLAVTHDLKTPLSAVKLGVESMRRLTLNPTDQESILVDMQSGVRSLERRIEDILTATRLQGTPHFELLPFEWELCMRQALDRLDEHAKKRVDIHTTSRDDSDGAGLVWGDEALWLLAAVNVLENSLKYSAGRVEFLWSESAHHVSFTVTDEGPGVPAHQWADALEPFVRLSEEGAGTGLGLHLVSQTAKLHGAKLLAKQLQNGKFMVHLTWPQKG
ncbi:MAG: HAMP domain-containing sensor histidine kinase [Bacteroidetes bacterium]|nr:HAMP domain-containing sensor histidine kinase [Bacteroidota bacterium]MDA0904468.1 HAMP domain-containing sensor histidine kinase [Bacteroidota bacterium]MDA1241680.1 HAMP domain-containing sensor histidine kinase [Bacteroidota bacterium]